ncbi:hypothetical protein [Kitasatospora sp. McL0602]|uniref:hypothetical protein n=1 Tax=Kitasatospora sp. McL0602 TaxID=3439530 RepID=UPI003F8BDAF7
MAAVLLGLLALLGAGPGECHGHRAQQHQDGSGLPVAAAGAAAAARCAPAVPASADCCATPGASYAAPGHVPPEGPEGPKGGPVPGATADGPSVAAGVAPGLPPPRPSGGRATLTGICVSRT